ncbi:hypothetical protein D3C77_28960 [compost metagenome]
MSKLAYVVKYALTTGVQVVDVEKKKIEPSGISDGCWYGKWSESTWCGQSFKEGRDFSFDKEEAEKLFDEMKAKKLKSLDKQISKISKLTFKIEG